jgi:signal peptidase I
MSDLPPAGHADAPAHLPTGGGAGDEGADSTFQAGSLPGSAGSAEPGDGTTANAGDFMQPGPGDPATGADLGNGTVVPRISAKDKRRRRRRRLLIEWLVVLAVAAIVAILLRAFVVQAFFVPSPSMEPTLQVGDRILVVKTTLLTGPVTRGDIVVFQHPQYFPCSAGTDDDIEDLVKRVIGLPGETIWSQGNTIYINGKVLKEPGWYRAGYAQVGATPITKQTIPSGDYFVMGDNRTDSCDSRMFGPIQGSSIIGQVELIVWRNGHPYFHAF